ncbi:MAG: glycosyltransferase family 2 protein [Alkalilacustris sp.]
MSGPGRVGAVVIGRNEGARLVLCLAAIPDTVRPVVYVDSGSTDGSPEAAARAGARVVMLDTDIPFTAARARNAGVAAMEATDRPAYVQFIDGDCALAPGWIAAAAAFLEAHPDCAVVCGRLRERHPERSVYNRLADREWDAPVGPATACGGLALMRLDAFAAVGGFDPALIAGEEPELCARLRAAGWTVHRLADEMALHDVAMTRFSQWWRRTRRGGLAFALGASRHGRAVDRARQRRALLWGLGLPVLVVAAAAVSPLLALALALAWPAQVVRTAWRDGIARRISWEVAVFAALAKVPEALGVLEYHLRQRSGRDARLIEYK